MTRVTLEVADSDFNRAPPRERHAGGKRMSAIVKLALPVVMAPPVTVTPDIGSF
jgi:hypothetical protein